MFLRCTAGPRAPPPPPAPPKPMRILIVGGSNDKARVLARHLFQVNVQGTPSTVGGRRSVHGVVNEEAQSRHRSSLTSTSFIGAPGRPTVIVNDVPARDLDNPLLTSDFEDYLFRASCVIICVQEWSKNWDVDAARWRARVRNLRVLPLAVLVEVQNGEGSAIGKRIVNRMVPLRRLNIFSLPRIASDMTPLNRLETPGTISRETACSRRVLFLSRLVLVTGIDLPQERRRGRSRRTLGGLHCVRRPSEGPDGEMRRNTPRTGATARARKGPRSLVLRRGQGDFFLRAIVGQ